MANNTAQHKFIKVLNTAELISIAGVILGIVLNKFYKGGDIVTAIALSSLSMVFFLNAYTVNQPLKEEQKNFTSLLTDKILPKVLWINSAVAATGILFYLNAFEGGDSILNISFINNSVLIAIFILLRFKNLTSEELMEPIKRAIPLFLICGYLLFL